MARPRSITDQAIIAEAYELMMTLGPNKFTLEQLGGKTGLVPAALVRRFKTKQKLIAEIDKYALELTNAKVQEAMSKTSSSIDAILAQFTTELAFASTVDRFANGLEFLLMDLRDKDLYTNYRISYIHRHEQVAELLKEALETGELQGVTDINELARHLEMIMHGSGHVWAMTQEGPIDEYISRHVALALKPYLKRKNPDRSA